MPTIYHIDDRLVSNMWSVKGDCFLDQRILGKNLVGKKTTD